MQYEPELFPGLIYRMKVPKVVLLIFVSGKVVLTGEPHGPKPLAEGSCLHGGLLSWWAQVPRREQTCIRPLS